MRATLALLLSLLTVEPAAREIIVYETVVVTVEVQREPLPTPIADSLVDWEELERQTDCLWVYLQAHFGHDITLDRVLAAGYWTDELGGACAVIGEDDESNE